jgi:hypothetical protein
MRMKTKTKILTGVVVALVVALPLISSTIAEQDNGEENAAPDSSLEDRLRQFIMSRLSQQRRNPNLVWFFKGAEAVDVEGEVAAHHNNILVLTADEEERLYIVLPRVWNINSDIVRLQQIYEQDLFSIGDEITVKALKRTVTNENGVTVTMIFGYEINDLSNGNHLYAVLPVNIEG